MNKAIRQFFRQISWQDECKIISIDKVAFVKAPLCLYLPAKWQDVDTAMLLVKKHAKTLSLEPALLIYGDPPDVDAISIYVDAIKKGFHPWFLDAKASVATTHYMCQALDGLDWARTIPSFLSGNTEPIWEWD